MWHWGFYLSGRFSRVEQPPCSGRPVDHVCKVIIGLGSMVGAGVFAAFIPASQAAGSGLLVGPVIAAAVPNCNTTASAQLAAQSPTSGGSFVYGRERLSPWPGFWPGGASSSARRQAARPWP